MRVVYVGNFRHHFCTEVHLSKTMMSLGVDVVEVQEDNVRVSELDGFIQPGDIFMYTRTWGMDDPAGLSRKLAEFKQEGIVSMSYHLDLYHGISREKSVIGDPFWETEYVFTPDGSPEAAKFFKDSGINHYYLKPGVFKPECYMGLKDPRFHELVGFVGTVNGYHREWPYRVQLDKVLRKFFGETYTKQGHPETLLRGKELNNFYASVPVIVGDTLCPGFTKTYYWSDRVYETIGRGGFLIHPYIGGLEEEFTDGENIVFYNYGDFEDLRDKVNFYLENPEERERIRRNGFEFVRDNCTYENRIKEAFGVMGYDL